jgi:hypothetical protein
LTAPSDRQAEKLDELRPVNAINGQRRRLRYANPIHAASKSDTPRVSGDQSGAREGQSTAGADTKERLNTCNRRLFTRALPTYGHPASTVGGARALSTPGDFVASVLDKTLRGGGGHRRTDFDLSLLVPSHDPKPWHQSSRSRHGE